MLNFGGHRTFKWKGLVGNHICSPGLGLSSLRTWPGLQKVGHWSFLSDLYAHPQICLISRFTAYFSPPPPLPFSSPDQFPKHLPNPQYFRAWFTLSFQLVLPVQLYLQLPSSFISSIKTFLIVPTDSITPLLKVPYICFYLPGILLSTYYILVALDTRDTRMKVNRHRLCLCVAYSNTDMYKIRLGTCVLKK